MKTTSTDYEANFKNASADNVLPSSLIRKIVSILGKRPAPVPVPVAAPASTSAITGEPSKQLFGGRLPPFIERIIQRIQNYFSVYNPPEYFDSNRPPLSPSSAAQHTAITLICSNTTSGSVSCSETSSSEEQQEEEENQQQQGETLEVCDGAGGDPPANFQEENSDGGGVAVGPPQDEYNVVVTHTVVQDSSLNVYSPASASPIPFANANTADSAHMVSNVVVILEPAAGQYSPPPLDNPDKNKFYVYVNPTSANKNQPQRLKTWNESADRDGDAVGVAGDADKISNFQPFANTAYTVIIRGDKLQEYNADLQNADNNSLNPEIAIYVRNSTTKKLKKCKLPLQAGEAEADDDVSSEDCDQGVSLASRSVPMSTNSSDEMYNDNNNNNTDAETIAAKANNNENSNKVPNINLMLVPPNDQPSKSKNKSCASKKKANKHPQLEYYVLKPDNNVNKGKTEGDDKEKTTFYLHKTSIGSATLSQTYLPPQSLPSSPSTPASPSSNDQPQNGESDERQ